MVVNRKIYNCNINWAVVSFISRVTRTKSVFWLVSPEAARRNHKNVSILGKKCPVHQIRKSFISSSCFPVTSPETSVLSILTFTNVLDELTFIEMFSLCLSSQNSAVSPPTWRFKWSDFSTKRRSPSMQKSLRFVSGHVLPPCHHLFIVKSPTWGFCLFWRMSSSHSCWTSMSSAPRRSRRKCCPWGQSSRRSRTRI